MREIKFRGLNANNEWVYGLISKDTEGSTMYYTEMPYRMCWFEDSAHCNQPIITNSIGQFTGMKDKNGKEIYEGDIIRTGTDKLMVITWSDKFASFCIYREGWAFQHWFGEACNPEDCTIEGNIYENPDLL